MEETDTTDEGNMTVVDWEIIETKEELLAAKVGDEWSFSGDLSELMLFTFSEDWSSNMYSQYYVDFWQGLLDDLGKREATAEIELDIQFDFGIATEEDVKEYMKTNKDNGPRLLVMHREEDHVSMTCAWMRGYTVKDLTASI
jgi:hypothetical protein